MAAIEVTFMATTPVLLSVTDCAALVVPTTAVAKVSELGDTDATGMAPVPLSDTTCGLPVALSETVSWPVRVPVAIGVKVTWIEQLPPAATDVPQLFVSAKSPLVPIEVIERAPLPLFVSVTVCDGEVEFSS